MIEELFLLLIAGFVSAFINSLAGGGGLLTYAVLTSMGIVPLQANMITAIGLWPGAVSGAAVYASSRKQIARKEFLIIVLMVVGGLTGGILLLNTGEKHFVIIIPYLLLFVFLLFLLKQQLIERLVRTSIARKTSSQRKIVLPVYLLIALYGSYFGAGVGLLLLATLLMERQGRMKALNKIKLLLVMLKVQLECCYLFQPAFSL